MFNLDNDRAFLQLREKDRGLFKWFKTRHKVPRRVGSISTLFWGEELFSVEGSPAKQHIIIALQCQ